MTSASLRYDRTSLTLAFADGADLTLPAAWLRDLIGDGTEVGEPQRRFDLAGLDQPVTIAEAVLRDDATLRITFAPEASAICVSLDWLRRQTGAGLVPAARRLWDAGLQVDLPWYRMDDVLSDPGARRAWLAAVRELGFALVSGAGGDQGTVATVAGLFGHVRETNYGRVFDVISEPAPDNLANSDAGLSLHTDNPYREPVPGLQLLHCLEASAEGGETLLADGFRAAARLRAEHRRDFDLLTRVSVDYRYVAKGVDLRARRPMIRLDAEGEIQAVAHNNRSRAPLAPTAGDLAGFYEAYRRFVRLLHDEDGLVRLRLAPGDLVIMDNERVLHGRGEFSGGRRRLRGCYADKDALASRLRVLEGEA